MSEEKKYDDADWVKSRIRDIFRRSSDALNGFCQTFNQEQSKNKYAMEILRCDDERADLFENVNADLLRRCVHDLGYVMNDEKSEDVKRELKNRRLSKN